MRKLVVRAGGLALAVQLFLGTVIQAGPADAWANGRDGPDSFGAHDWVLARAVEAVKDGGAWVHLGIALRATDDPDTRDGIDHASGTWWHVWDEWGATYGGAPEAAQVWFDRALAHLKAGRRRAASRALGIMSHFVADVAQPMHTDGSDAENGVHSPYETAVDQRISTYTFRFDGRDPADPFQRTLKVARVAHRSYHELVAAYDASGYDLTVDSITRRQLNRAANALADLIIVMYQATL